MQSSTFCKLVDPRNPAVVAGHQGHGSGRGARRASRTRSSRRSRRRASTRSSRSTTTTARSSSRSAAQAAGSDDPAKIKDEMIEVSQGGTKCQTYADCLALLKAGEDIDYDGASGAGRPRRRSENRRTVSTTCGRTTPTAAYANIDGRRADQDLGVVSRDVRSSRHDGPRATARGSLRVGLLDLGERAEVELDDLRVVRAARRRCRCTRCGPDRARSRGGRSRGTGARSARRSAPTRRRR